MSERISGLLKAMAGRRIVIVGDLMLDGYLEGDVERISPEAPVPVVRVTRDWVSPGGAGNAALQCTALGAKVTIRSVIGDDTEGRRLLGALAEEGITDQSGIEVAAGLATVTKTRVVSGGQQLLRIDREVVPDGDSADADGAAEAAQASVSDLAALLAGADAAIVSDYDKGGVDRVLRGRTREELAATAIGLGIPLIVDSKSPDALAYSGCGVATPNRHEAQVILGTRIDDTDAALAAAERLRHLTGCGAVVITLGAWGMALSAEDSTQLLPTIATDVADVTGAGDTVAATIAVAMAAGADVVEACKLASLAAGVVVRRRFTSRATPADIIDLARRQDLEPG